jgi:glycine oxidase
VSSHPGHILIAGAGIVGLACALRLADSGFRVTVLERGHAMQQSSWAAAGMLAAHDPENPPALLPLSLLSLSLYPAFLARVTQLSGIAVPLRTHATQQGNDTADQFFPLAEHSLDPRDLCRALPAAVRAAGVALREQSAITAVTNTPAGVRVILASGAVLDGQAFVLACGAWSGQIKLPAGIPPLPVQPRKGQMIEVTMPGRFIQPDEAHPQMPRLDTVLRTPTLYLVPRGDGRIVIGSTVEDAGFDRTIDEAAGNRLFESAAALWPPLRQGTITARWTGLRPSVVRPCIVRPLIPGDLPTLPDALPIIGPLDSSSSTHCYAATGHFRNGILLAPATAHLIAQLLRNETSSIALDAFMPSRFARAAQLQDEALTTRS